MCPSLIGVPSELCSIPACESQRWPSQQVVVQEIVVVYYYCYYYVYDYYYDYYY